MFTLISKYDKNWTYLKQLTSKGKVEILIKDSRNFEDLREHLMYRKYIIENLSFENIIKLKISEITGGYVPSFLWDFRKIQFPNLRKLILNCSEIGFLLFHGLEVFLQKIPNLFVFDLKNTTIRFVHFESIKNKLKSCRHFEDLVFFQRCFSDQDGNLYPLPHENIFKFFHYYQKLNNLTNLNIDLGSKSYFKFKDDFLIKIVKGKKNLKELNIANSFVTKNFFESCQNDELKNLKILNISNCELMRKCDLDFLYGNFNLETLIMKNMVLSIPLQSFETLFSNLKETLLHLDISLNSNILTDESDQFVKKDDLLEIFLKIDWNLRYLDLQGIPLNKDPIQKFINSNFFQEELITLRIDSSASPEIKEILKSAQKIYQNFLYSSNNEECNNCLDQNSILTILYKEISQTPKFYQTLMTSINEWSTKKIFINMQDFETNENLLKFYLGRIENKNQNIDEMIISFDGIKSKDKDLPINIKNFGLKKLKIINPGEWFSKIEFREEFQRLSVVFESDKDFNLYEGKFLNMDLFNNFSISLEFKNFHDYNLLERVSNFTNLQKISLNFK